MDELLIKESSESPKDEPTGVFLWGRLGPALLLGAFAIFLFRTAPMYWPLTLLSFLGYAIISVSGKKGLWCSLAALCCVFLYVKNSGGDIFWTSLLSLSIAVSWILIYLGGIEEESFSSLREETVLKIEKESQEIAKQLREAKSALSSEKQHIEMLQKQFADQMQHTLAQHKQHLDALLAENGSFKTKMAELSDEKAGNAQYVERLLSENGTLKTQLSELQSRLAALCTDEEEEVAEEPVHDEQLKYQLAALRGQFEEKSEALNQSRRDLFKLENEHFVLLKSVEEMQLTPSSEELGILRDLKSLEARSLDLEEQIDTLEKIISHLVLPKKRAPAKRKKKGASEQDLLPGM